MDESYADDDDCPIALQSSISVEKPHESARQ